MQQRTKEIGENIENAAKITRKLSKCRKCSQETRYLSKMQKNAVN